MLFGRRVDFEPVIDRLLNIAGRLPSELDRVLVLGNVQSIRNGAVAHFAIEYVKEGARIA